MQPLDAMANMHNRMRLGSRLMGNMVVSNEDLGCPYPMPMDAHAHNAMCEHQR